MLKLITQNIPQTFLLSLLDPSNDGWFHHPYKVGPRSSYKWSYNPRIHGWKSMGNWGWNDGRTQPTKLRQSNSRTLRFSSADLIGCTALWSLLHSFCFEVNLWEKRRRRFGCTKIRRFPPDQNGKGKKVLGSFFSDVKTESFEEWKIFRTHFSIFFRWWILVNPPPPPNVHPEK